MTELRRKVGVQVLERSRSRHLVDEYAKRVDATTTQISAIERTLVRRSVCACHRRGVEGTRVWTRRVRKTSATSNLGHYIDSLVDFGATSCRFRRPAASFFAPLHDFSKIWSVLGTLRSASIPFKRSVVSASCNADLRAPRARVCRRSGTNRRHRARRVDATTMSIVATNRRHFRRPRDARRVVVASTRRAARARGRSFRQPKPQILYLGVQRPNSRGWTRRPLE